MKNLARKLLATLIIATMVVPMTTVMAKSNDNKPESSVQKSVAALEKSQSKTEKQAAAQQKAADKKAEVQQKVAERKQNHDALKAEIKAKKDTIKANNTQLQAIRKDIVTKKDSINTILNALTESNKVVPSDLLDAIKAQGAVLKTDLQAVNSGKGSLEKAGKDVAEQVKGKNADGVLKGLDNVIAKQTARISALNKLSSDLDVMLQLAQKAQSLATDPVVSALADTTSSATDTSSTVSEVSSEVTSSPAI